MAEVQSIAAFRKRKKIRKWMKTGLIVLLLLAIAASAWLASDALAGKRTQDFSTSLKGVQPLRVCAAGNYGAVLSNAGVSIFDADGERKKEVLHGFTNPVIRAAGNRFLSYDRGGTRLRVDTAKGFSEELRLSDSLLTAQISPGGLVAVVTEDDRYACRVTVYDAALRQELYHYYGTEVLTALAFSGDGKRLYGAAAVTAEGIVSTNLYTLDLQKETVEAPMLIVDILPVALCWSEGDTLRVIGDRSVVTCDCAEKSQTVYTYRGDLLHFVNCDADRLLLATRSPFSSYTDLTLFSADGSVLATRTLQEDVLDVSGDGKRIAVLERNAVSIYDMTLRPTDTISLSHSMLGAALSGSRLWTMGGDVLEGYHLS